MENITGVLYREEQNLPGWVYLLFVIWIPILFVILYFTEPEIFKKDEFLRIILPVGLILLSFDFIILGIIGKLTVLVKWNEMVIQMGFFRLTVRRIKKVEIKSVKIIDGSLWKKYGGWGVKASFETIAYVYSGKGGVEIEVESLNERKLKLWKLRKIVISSKNPNRFAEAIMAMS